MVTILISKPKLSAFAQDSIILLLHSILPKLKQKRYNAIQKQKVATEKATWSVELLPFVGDIKDIPVQCHVDRCRLLSSIKHSQLLVGELTSLLTLPRHIIDLVQG